MFAPATLSEYLGLPLDFGDRVDLGGATAAGMVWRAAAAVELGQCDAVLAVMPGSTEVPRSETKPGPDTQLVRRVEQQLRLAAGRVRDPVRQRRAERPVRADRPALRRTNSATTPRPWRASRSHQRDQRVRPSRRGVPRQADHRRRRARQPDDRRPDPHARDRDAGAGRRGRADRQRRRRATGSSSPGVDQGFRRAHPLQDADLRRRPHPHADRAAPPNGRSRWRGCSGPTSTWRRSTTATRSPC